MSPICNNSPAQPRAFAMADQADSFLYTVLARALEQSMGVQSTETRQHSLGVAGQTRRSIALHCWQVQRSRALLISLAGAGQHSLGVCNGIPGEALLFTSLARAAEQLIYEFSRRNSPTRPGRLQWQTRRITAVHIASEGGVAAHG